MDSSIGKFCPVCKFKNESTATVCANCQAPLENVIITQITTKRLAENASLLSHAELEALIQSFIPAKGLTFYIVNNGELIIVGDEQSELILGRKIDDSVKNLINIGAYDVFVSRRHAKVVKSENGYEITDLGSSNGTWLEEQRLIPHKSYPLQNGAQIRLGHIQVMFHYSSTGS
ncbi:MAG TPA: FHA domain-containing protein [Anaerolineales bacterium]|jgi:hypothetical protein